MKNYVKEFQSIVEQAKFDTQIISEAQRIICEAQKELDELQAERNRYDTEIIRLKTKLGYPESKMLEHREVVNNG